MAHASEWEKMLAGEYYLAGDPGLKDARHHARAICRQYNNTIETEREKRQEILRGFFGFVGENILIEPPFQCDYGKNIFFGHRSFLNYNCVILDGNTVHIGDDVLIGPAVQIYTASHPTDPEDRLRELEYTLPVRIGNNVWIGGGAIICPGVTIGDNCTIGAGSVVVNDIPAYSIAVGNPCRVIRSIDQKKGSPV